MHEGAEVDICYPNVHLHLTCEVVWYMIHIGEIDYIMIHKVMLLLYSISSFTFLSCMISSFTFTFDQLFHLSYMPRPPIHLFEAHRAAS